jgi:hypothetical protein
MPVNEFLPFAAGVGANVIDQATWQVLPGRGTGFVAGTALSGQVNKALRQPTFVAAVFGQYIVDKANLDALDDGTTATLLARFKTAVGLDIQDGVETFAIAGGTANAITVTLAPAPLAIPDGMRIMFRPQSNNTGACTLNVNGSGVLPLVRMSGLALTPGDLIAGTHAFASFDAAAFRWTLVNPAAGEPRSFTKRFSDVTVGTRNFTAVVTAIHRLTVEGAGGGGGAGLTTGAGGGGGGGGTVEDFIYLVNGGVYTYTVGTGGTGAVAGTSNNGVAGTSTSFTGTGGTVTATGGSGGTGAAAGASGGGGAGGSGSGQSANGRVTGGYSGLQGQNVGTPTNGGGGGNSTTGQGGPESNGNGNPGGAPGGGGSGSTASGFGGAGANGRMTVEW